MKNTSHKKNILLSNLAYGEEKSNDKILPIIIGIESTKLSEAEIQLFKSHPVYGFILFSRNLDGLNKQQVIELNSSLKNLYPDREPDSVKIFVDQEGGRVARIKPPLAQEKYPPAIHFAEIYEKGSSSDKEEAKQKCYDNYHKIMTEAKELGFDSLCAPVCDLIFKGASNIIGDRSFGDDANQVTELAGAAIEGIYNANGIPFIKHIPGHGRALVDSHYQLPHVDTSLKELTKTDFIPFKKLASRYKKDANDNNNANGSYLWGMTAHIIYQCIDKDTPLTLSKKGIDYIRENIFDGVIVSDDIGMLALHGDLGQRKLEYKKLHREFPDLHKASEVTDELISILHKLSGNAKSNESIENLANDEICNRIDDYIERQFPASLASVTKKAFKAGCDYVLHCSGDIKEAEAVLIAAEDAFEETNL